MFREYSSNRETSSLGKAIHCEDQRLEHRNESAATLSLIALAGFGVNVVGVRFASRSIIENAIAIWNASGSKTSN